MPRKILRFGIIVDTQAALEIAFGGANKPCVLAGIDKIDPVSIVKGAYEKFGIKIIELPLDANCLIPGIVLKKDSIRGMQRFRDLHQLEYTMHLPSFQVALCSANAHVRRGSIEAMVETFKTCEMLGGINNYVLRLTGDLEDQVSLFHMAQKYKELAWNHFLERGYDSLQEIISRTGIDPKKICIENSEGVPFSNMYDVIIDEIGTSICLDVGHVVLQGDEAMIDFMRRWKDKVHEIHLHNVLCKYIANRCRVLDDHHGLAQGIIDVPLFLEYLEKIDFQHPVLLEVSSQKEIVDSISYLKETGFMQTVLEHTPDVPIGNHF
nr:cobamide remodeling phosphodiesterase CbiR [Candidatus Sigynarchaeota archaeon]